MDIKITEEDLKAIIDRLNALELTTLVKYKDRLDSITRSLSDIAEQNSEEIGQAYGRIGKVELRLQKLEQLPVDISVMRANERNDNRAHNALLDRVSKLEQQADRKPVGTYDFTFNRDDLVSEVKKLKDQLAVSNDLARGLRSDLNGAWTELGVTRTARDRALDTIGTLRKDIKAKDAVIEMLDAQVDELKAQRDRADQE
jgi:SMC interacting uncharacterized protein involved in chromosome segregation